MIENGTLETQTMTQNGTFETQTMSESRTLYHFETAHNWRVKIALHLKGLSCEYKTVNLLMGEQKSPEILALNPRGKVPILLDGDVIVKESAACVLYLDAMYPNPPLLPSDLAAKARAFDRAVEFTNLNTIVDSWSTPMAFGYHHPEEERLLEESRAEFQIWEKYFGEYKYSACDEFTYADILIAPNVIFAYRFGMRREKFPEMTRYYDLVKTHPSIVATSPESWKAGPPMFDMFKLI